MTKGTYTQIRNEKLKIKTNLKNRQILKIRVWPKDEVHIDPNT